MRTGKKLSRRAALAGVGVALGSGMVVLPARRVSAAQPQAAGRDPLAAIPITGQAGKGLEPFDAAMRTIIDRHGLAGAALAITKDGRLVLAKGYGWANI